MERLVNALFLDKTSAGQAVDELVAQGYRPGTISVTVPPLGETRHQDAGVEVSHAHKTSRGATIGGVIGGATFGILSAIFLGHVDPVIAAVAGFSAGGLGGSLAGALVGSWVRAAASSRRAKPADRGGVVVAVRTDDSHRGAAEVVLSTAGGKFVQAS